MEKRKHVRDLAPFASSEDLSDERESPLDEDKQKPKLSNIEEEVMKTPPKAKTLNVVANVAPRIDISRASSSSHQEDSSPERELYLGKSEGPKLEIAFGEEMASDLHSSTEELSFQEDDTDKQKRKKSSQMDLPPENYLRKDSGCSDIALLSISGRTSRVSSVGSVGSGASCYSGLSHCSAASRLSATSNLSRGSSPHRMSVETSFCGPKPVHTASLDVEETANAIIDKLKQKTEVANQSTKESVDVAAKTETTHRSRRLVSSSQTSMAKNVKNGVDVKSSRHKRKKPAIENPKTQKFVSLHSDEEDEPIASRSVNAKTTTSAKPPSLDPASNLDTRTQIYIPLKGSFDGDSTPGKCEPNPNSPKRLKPFTNSLLINFIHKYDPDRVYRRASTRSKSATEADYKSKSEIYKEFQTFINERDDDDCADGRRIKHIKSTSAINTMVRSQEKFPPENKVSAPKSEEKSKALAQNTQITVPIQVHQSSSPTEPDICELAPSPPKHDLGLPKYLMTNDGTTQYIPLRGSDSELQQAQSKNQNNYLTVSKLEVKSRSDDRNLPYLGSSGSNIDNHSMASSLELNYRDRSSRSTKSMTQLVNVDHSRTPSPNASMHKNGNNAGGNHQNYLYRRCSESAKEIHRIGKPKSRSGSFRSLFSTIFKRGGSFKHKKGDKSETPERSTSSAASADYYVKPKPKTSEPDSIIIPLHSPDEIPMKEINSINKVVRGIPSENSALKNRNNTNINDEPPTIIMTTVKMEYSEDQIKAEEIKVPQRADGKASDKLIDDELSRPEIQSSQHTLSTPTKPQPEPHEMQGEVTVHRSEGMKRTETRSRNEKLKRTVRIESSDSNKFAQVQEPPEVSADDRERSYSLMTDREQILSPAANENAEDGDDVSTDSDKDPTVVQNDGEEHKKLVNQQEESFEELPYVPTTLPLERSVALPIVPIKERVSEVRTCSVDRPRSGSTLNPASLETYVNSLPPTTMTAEPSLSTEKLHITLPRTDPLVNSHGKKLPPTKSKTTPCVTSKRHHSLSAFVGDDKKSSPPPLPPRKSSLSWISFDDTGQEVRQSPRRITTLPSSYAVETRQPTGDRFSKSDHSERRSSENVILAVDPDECPCECHEDTILSNRFSRR